MSEPVSEATQSILAALKTYATCPVAIIGCHAARLSRPSCEYDLLLVTDEGSPPKSLRVGDSFVDLMFVGEEEIRKAEDPEFLSMLSLLVPLRDSSWLLASAASSAKGSLPQNSARASELRLGAALKALGRVDENLSGGNVGDADFWLLAAGYSFSYALLYADEVVPSPSHLLSQMQAASGVPVSMFEAWAEAVGLPLAARTSCENRLNGLEVVYDVLGTVEMPPALAKKLGRYRSQEAYQIVKSKAASLLNGMQSAECFAYLGLETVLSLTDLLEFHAHGLGKEPDYPTLIADLTKGNERLIGEEMTRDMGLVRPKEIVENAAASLKDSISSHAKRV